MLLYISAIQFNAFCTTPRKDLRINSKTKGMVYFRLKLIDIQVRKFIDGIEDIFSDF